MPNVAEQSQQKLLSSEEPRLHCGGGREETPNQPSGAVIAEGWPRELVGSGCIQVLRSGREQRRIEVQDAPGAADVPYGRPVVNLTRITGDNVTRASFDLTPPAERTLGAAFYDADSEAVVRMAIEGLIGTSDYGLNTRLCHRQPLEVIRTSATTGH